MIDFRKQDYGFRSQRIMTDTRSPEYQRRSALFEYIKQELIRLHANIKDRLPAEIQRFIGRPEYIEFLAKLLGGDVPAAKTLMQAAFRYNAHSHYGPDVIMEGTIDVENETGLEHRTVRKAMYRLQDFGLWTVVKPEEKSGQVYRLTGYTHENFIELIINRADELFDEYLKRESPRRQRKPSIRKGMSKLPSCTPENEMILEYVRALHERLDATQEELTDARNKLRELESRENALNLSDPKGGNLPPSTGNIPATGGNFPTDLLLPTNTYEDLCLRSRDARSALPSQASAMSSLSFFDHERNNPQEDRTNGERSTSVEGATTGAEQELCPIEEINREGDPVENSQANEKSGATVVPQVTHTEPGAVAQVSVMKDSIPEVKKENTSGPVSVLPPLPLQLNATQIKGSHCKLDQYFVDYVISKYQPVSGVSETWRYYLELYRRQLERFASFYGGYKIDMSYHDRRASLNETDRELESCVAAGLNEFIRRRNQYAGRGRNDWDDSQNLLWCRETANRIMRVFDVDLLNINRQITFTDAIMAIDSVPRQNAHSTTYLTQVLTSTYQSQRCNDGYYLLTVTGRASVLGSMMIYPDALLYNDWERGSHNVDRTIKAKFVKNGGWMLLNYFLRFDSDKEFSLESVSNDIRLAVLRMLGRYGYKDSRWDEIIYCCIIDVAEYKRGKIMFGKDGFQTAEQPTLKRTYTTLVPSSGSCSNLQLEEMEELVWHTPKPLGKYINYEERKQKQKKHVDNKGHRKPRQIKLYRVLNLEKAQDVEKLRNDAYKAGYRQAVYCDDPPPENPYDGELQYQHNLTLLNELLAKMGKDVAREKREIMDKHIRGEIAKKSVDGEIKKAEEAIERRYAQKIQALRTDIEKYQLRHGGRS